MSDRARRGPLSGSTVIELAGIGPGPFAGMLLADLGADVVCIQRPGAPPPATDLLDRGKRSVVLDLKRPEAVEAVLRLVERADVLVESYRPGVVDRLGLGPRQASARNPRLVYGRMTGWGQDGPLAHTAGHDVDYIALTGALHAIGPRHGAPVVPLNLVGDLGGGSLYLVVGVLAALLEARVTGRGQVVDAAIVDGTSHMLAAIHALLAAGQWVDERGANLVDGGTPFYAVYATSDGGHMAVGALEPAFFAELVRLLEVDIDPAAQQDRATWPRMRTTFAEAFCRRTRDEWTTIFHGSDACVAPVLGLREAASHPHMAARGSIAERDGVLQPGVAPRLSGHEPARPPRPPTRGADTRAVLAAVDLDADMLISEGIASES